jgi:CBS domain containing-hemolysin-like protein
MVQPPPVHVLVKILGVSTEPTALPDLPSILWRILATLALVALNAYFVTSEYSAVTARATRLETEARKSLLARLALLVKNRLDLYMSSCQLGVTLASLGLGAVTEPAVAAIIAPFLRLFDLPEHDIHAIAFAIALAIATSLHIVIGEQAPKNWAIRFADRALPLLAPPLIVFTYVFFPLIWLLNAATNAVLRMTGIRQRLGLHGALPHTREELRALVIQAVAQGSIARTYGRLLMSAFEFGERKVRQVMTPRTQVDYLLLNQPIGDILKTVKKSGYTRYPLCDKDIDHAIGMVHIKDLFNQLQLVPGKLRFIDEKSPEGLAIAIPDGLPGSQVHVIGSADIDLTKIKRDVLFVPELLPVPRLLRQFQTSRSHMAIVVDEYGATLGIATLEDVIEELVGEIEDEFDIAAARDFIKEGDNYRVSGLLPLHVLRERFPLVELEETDVDTLAGYIIQKLNRWPRAGDTVSLGPYVAKVLSVQHRRIGQVLITPAAREDRPPNAGEA